MVSIWLLNCLLNVMKAHSRLLAISILLGGLYDIQINMSSRVSQNEPQNQLSNFFIVVD